MFIVPLIFFSFLSVNLVIFWHLRHTLMNGYFVRATSLTVLFQSFWNFAVVLLMVSSCARDLDIYGHNNGFFSTCDCSLSLASRTQINGWVLCERKISYSFIPIFLKLSGCSLMIPRCAHGLDIIIFFFFQLVNIVIFRHLRRNEWVLWEHNSSYSFILMLLKLCRCFAHGLKMCMWFGFYLHIDYFFFITETKKSLTLGDSWRAQPSIHITMYYLTFCLL